MTAPHFFVDSLDGDVVVLTGEDAHHATRALRIRPGERITLADGKGTVAGARVVAVESGRDPTLRAEVLTRRTVEQNRPRIVVFPALPTSGKLDLVVQKLTELGVDSIRPWFAARSVARWDEAKARAHGDRLRAIAREAAKQSRRARLPEVLDAGLLDALPPLSVVLHEEAEQRLLAVLPPGPSGRASPSGKASPSGRASPSGSEGSAGGTSTVEEMEIEEIGIVVGPEGGLDPAEVDRLRVLGATLASLGEQILRTETAAIVGPALVMAQYGRLG